MWFRNKKNRPNSKPSWKNKQTTPLFRPPKPSEESSKNKLFPPLGGKKQPGAQPLSPAKPASKPWPPGFQPDRAQDFADPLRGYQSYQEKPPRSFWKKLAGWNLILSSLFILLGSLYYNWNLMQKEFEWVVLDAGDFYSEKEWRGFLELTNKNSNNFLAYDTYKQSLKLNLMPWIEQAQVLKFPPNFLKLEATLRRPFLYLVVNNKTVMIDKEGKVLPLTNRNKTWDLPVLRLENLSNPAFKPYEAFYWRKLLQLFQLLQQNPVIGWQNIDVINASGPYAITVEVLPYGYKLKLTIENFEQELKMWAEHYRYFAKALPRVSSVDLRTKGKITLRYKN